MSVALAVIGLRSGQERQEFANPVFEKHHIPELVQEIGPRQGSSPGLVESATVTEASGNAVGLKNLRPDGTIAEPGAEVADPTEAVGDEGWACCRADQAVTSRRRPRLCGTARPGLRTEGPRSARSG
jgi:hypothetical protein